MARPDPRTLWLVGPMALVFAAHVRHLPLWVTLAAALALLWRLAPLWRKDAASQRTLRWLLALAGMAGVFLEHRTLFGAQGGVSLLVLMAALKLLEAEGRRDHGVMVLVGFFLLMTTFIHDQGLGTAAWLLATALVLTASLVVAQSAAVPSPRPALKLGGTFILQALPLAVLLFLLFPRLPSPLGGLLQAPTGQTGLSDSMRPGSISQLIRSDAIAFRVDFATAGVDGRRLYWRGPVLWRYDGGTWRREERDGERADAETLGRPLDYTVTLEPHQQRWLLVAGLATEAPLPKTGLTADLEWMTDKPVRERLRYAVHAWPEYRLETLISPQRRARGLALPEGYNPRAVELGRRWAATEPDPEHRVRLALTLFRERPFHYTLSPPRLGEHAIDEFLFDTRRGFCEHYAAAFTVLMRAAGLPARVVTGYQGGEINPLGNYWIVRQRDAHAWAEVWLEGRGWVRVDPTAAVAPSRIEQGLAAALPLAERPLLGLDAAWLKPARQAWDFVNNGWNQWVLGYDFQRQRRFLEHLYPGLASLKAMLWTLLLGSALLLAGLALLTLRKREATHRDAVGRLYAAFRKRLARVGLAAGTGEGPADFARRAARARPDLAADIRIISGLYIHLRYSREPGAGLRELKQRVRTFRPRPK